jgi:hypothetical protein
MGVRWCPPLSVVIVTHFVIQPLAQILGYFRPAAVTPHPPRDQSLQDSGNDPIVLDHPGQRST